jgi:hypothetical protein
MELFSLVRIVTENLMRCRTSKYTRDGSISQVKWYSVLIRPFLRLPRQPESCSASRSGCSALKVNPILTIRDGLTEGVTRVRCRAKAIDYLGDFVMGFPDVEEVAIEDATTPDEAEILAERLGSRFPRERIYWMKVGPVIGTHVGPHVLGVGVLPG